MQGSASGAATAGRALAQSLLVFALFLRLLVPTGWMPAEGFALTPCPDAAPAVQPMAHGPMEHGAAAHSGHHGEQDEAPADHDQTKQTCAFAGLSAPLDGPPPMPAVPPSGLPASDALTARAEAPAAARGLAAPPPPSTGPPGLL